MSWISLKRGKWAKPVTRCRAYAAPLIEMSGVGKSTETDNLSASETDGHWKPWVAGESMWAAFRGNEGFSNKIVEMAAWVYENTWRVCFSLHMTQIATEGLWEGVTNSLVLPLSSMGTLVPQGHDQGHMVTDTCTESQSPYFRVLRGLSSSSGHWRPQDAVLSLYCYHPQQTHSCVRICPTHSRWSPASPTLDTLWQAMQQSLPKSQQD